MINSKTLILFSLFISLFLLTGCLSPAHFSKISFTENETHALNDCSFNKYNCSNFKTQQQAQEMLEKCGRNDIHGLDRDKDGKACE
jgi:hypothetical protein